MAARWLIIIVLAALAPAATAQNDDANSNVTSTTQGFYSTSVPAESVVIPGYSLREQKKRMHSLPLQSIEGIWEYHQEMMTVAIERFSSPQFSKHIAYRVVMLESEDLDLLPGTVIGYIAESADDDVYELWIYSEQNGSSLSSPMHCVATLSEESLTFKKMLNVNMKVRVNFARFLPSLFRGISVTPEIKQEPLPVGFRKLYPKAEKAENYDIRYL